MISYITNQSWKCKIPGRSEGLIRIKQIQLYKNFPMKIHYLSKKNLIQFFFFFYNRNHPHLRHKNKYFFKNCNHQALQQHLWDKAYSPNLTAPLVSQRLFFLWLRRNVTCQAWSLWQLCARYIKVKRFAFRVRLQVLP